MSLPDVRSRLWPMTRDLQIASVELLDGEHGVAEMKMFGGLAFLISDLRGRHVSLQRYLLRDL